MLAVSGTFVGVASAQTVVATVDVGGNPFGITVDPQRSRVYVAHPALGSGAVSVIDTSTNQKIDTLSVGQGPTDVAVDPKTGLLYVASNGGCCASDNRVIVVDPAARAVVSVITLDDDDPEWIEINPETRLAYVTYVFGLGHTRVAVVDLKSNTFRGSIEVGDGQGAITVDAARDRVYVGRYVAEGDTRISEVVVIDGSTNTVIDRIQLSFPLVRSTRALVRGLSLDPTGNGSTSATATPTLSRSSIPRAASSSPPSP
jgi:YVTN family beta-propeller protein